MKEGANSSPPPDLSRLRAALEGSRGRVYWRGLEDLSRSPEFERFLSHEFPAGATEWKDDLSRRDFLRLMAASFALAGLTSGCTKEPEGKIVPYVRPPEQVVPGRPQYFATAMPLAGYGYGVLACSHEGRPTKIEGNPDHPDSLGATNVFMQASILDLYDPDRSQVVLHNGAPSDWSSFIDASITADTRVAKTGRRGHPHSDRHRHLARRSPRRSSLPQDVSRGPLARPRARRPRQRAGSAPKPPSASELNTIYHFDKADVILSLDADFLCAGPGSLRYARDFTRRRRVRTIATSRRRR